MSFINQHWADEAVIMNAVSVTTGSLSSVVSLGAAGYEGAHVTVKADFPVSPTDNLEVYVQTSLDGTVFDDTAIAYRAIDKGTDPNQVSLVVRDAAYFRLFCKRSGSTDTISVTAKARPWRYKAVLE